MQTDTQFTPTSPLVYIPTLADWIAVLLRANPAICPHCLGTGEIDVHDPQTGWDTIPCPDCTPPDDELPF